LALCAHTAKTDGSHFDAFFASGRIAQTFFGIPAFAIFVNIPKIKALKLGFVTGWAKRKELLEGGSAGELGNVAGGTPRGWLLPVEAFIS
jgi:hypothetical protein